MPPSPPGGKSRILPPTPPSCGKGRHARKRRRRAAGKSKSASLEEPSPPPLPASPPRIHDQPPPLPGEPPPPPLDGPIGAAKVISPNDLPPPVLVPAVRPPLVAKSAPQAGADGRRGDATVGGARSAFVLVAAENRREALENGREAPSDDGEEGDGDAGKDDVKRHDDRRARRRRRRRQHAVSKGAAKKAARAAPAMPEVSMRTKLYKLGKGPGGIWSRKPPKKIPQTPPPSVHQARRPSRAHDAAPEQGQSHEPRGPRDPGGPLDRLDAGGHAVAAADQGSGQPSAVVNGHGGARPKVRQVGTRGQKPQQNLPPAGSHHEPEHATGRRDPRHRPPLPGADAQQSVSSDRRMSMNTAAGWSENGLEQAAQEARSRRCAPHPARGDLQHRRHERDRRPGEHPTDRPKASGSQQPEAERKLQPAPQQPSSQVEAAAVVLLEMRRGKLQSTSRGLPVQHPNQAPSRHQVIANPAPAASEEAVSDIGAMGVAAPPCPPSDNTNGGIAEKADSKEEGSPEPAQAPCPRCWNDLPLRRRSYQAQTARSLPAGK
ncbi:serine/arginine repetitive matrix protein 1-like [Pollicipes pollicipes]|uniref:serine/arginine repetitive matrix protein 1-like n=1 Tax=Pollicipes pollicipes TaxID=41117 RepID=UPI0018852CA6|nr:serine/arginine repetitive matrix protein 1-like [Pollicipes pollicipes]